MATNDLVGSVYDFGINGVGYILSTLDTESPFEYRSYMIEAIPMQLPRISSADEVSEAILGHWWVRGQHDWSDGEGQRVFDADFSSRRAIWGSRYCDFWSSPGNVIITKQVTRVDETSNLSHLLVDANYWYLAKNGQVGRNNAFTSPTFSNIGGPGAGSPVKSMTSDGTFLYVTWGDLAGNYGIRKADLDEATFGTTTSQVNTLEPDLIEFVKGRLMCAGGASLYEISDLTVTTAPSAHYTHPSTGWGWTSITESGPGIYATGYAGDKSELFVIRFDASDAAAGLTLGAPRSVWEAPRGEVIHKILGYLGKAVLIGTSRGLRIGTISTGEGDLDVSPLLIETVGYSDDAEHPVKHIAVFGEFAYIAWDQIHDYKYGASSVEQGIAKMHLGTLAWTRDLADDTTSDEPRGLVVYNGEPFWIDDRYVHYINTTGNYRSANAEMVIGEIRFGTLEEKVLRYWEGLFTTEHEDASLNGRYAIAIANEVDSFSTIVSTKTATGRMQRDLLQSDITNFEQGTRFNLKINLLPASGDQTSTPELSEWRLLAEPVESNARFRYYCPIMVYDFMTTNNGQAIGYDGFAEDTLDALIALYRNGTTFEFQTLNKPDVPVNAKIERMEYKQFAPPRGMRGSGGIALVIVKETG